MNIRKELEQQLKEINGDLMNHGNGNTRAILLVAKSNILLALQKYEEGVKIPAYRHTEKKYLVSFYKGLQGEGGFYDSVVVEASSELTDRDIISYALMKLNSYPKSYKAIVEEISNA
jgi:hypothetical protein